MAQSDVDEALRLMQMSKFSLYSDDRQKSGLDAISDIYSILRDEAARANKMDVSYAHALNWISRKVCSRDKRVELELMLLIIKKSEMLSNSESQSLWDNNTAWSTLT